MKKPRNTDYLKRSSYRNLKATGETKTRKLEEFQTNGTYSNIKHSPTPSQINRNPQTKGLFTSVPIIQYFMSIIQQKITSHAKRKENTWSEEIKQSSEPESDMTQILELLDGKNFK